ncbi:MAG TPA: PQQ-binding-like beta-propeller repeat protein [Thermoanaerobaculia bacterium]|nr:PQQ-binding-like beta-propeller repeat protein [Thermoanaerobaculia bacterium]
MMTVASCRSLLALVLLALGSPGVATAAEASWPSFRGAHAAGVAEGPAPTAWDAVAGTRILWKTEIPGLAHSSPVVWGDRVFVTTAVSTEADPTFRHGLYGDVDSVESKAEHSWRVLAIDRRTGKVLWERVAATGVPLVKRHMKATHANSTPATDGKHVVALFGSAGLYCYHVDGALLWKKDLGVLDAGWFYDPSYQWEHGSSPILHGNLVIVQADLQKGSFIAAFDLADGHQVWRTERQEIPSWATPSVFETSTRAELVTNATKQVRAYDPATGKELWHLTGNSEIVTPTPIAAHGLVFVTSGYSPIQPIYAIRLGAANGDITLAEGKEASDTIAWSKKRGGPYMPTPIVYGDHLYTCANNGILTAYDAKTGAQVYRERIAGGKGVAFTASPVAADGKLYLASEDGEIYVVKAGPKFELLATNPMGEVLMATPAIVDGTILVRARHHLFAIGEGKAAPAKPAGGR